MDTGKQLELEALALPSKMLLFDKAESNPEEAQRIRPGNEMRALEQNLRRAK